MTKNRTSILRRNYGLTQEEYNSILKKQNGVCILGPENCSHKLCVDHKGKFIRGILCTEHNRIVGSYEAILNIRDKIDLYIEGKLTEFIPNKSILSKCKRLNCSELGIARGMCAKHYKHFINDRDTTKRKYRKQKRKRLTMKEKALRTLSTLV